MKLWQTRRHWEKFARTDPLWAVLAAPDKSGNRWDIEDFFATGRAEVAKNLADVRARCPALRLGHALDFGCGVGRLTQALAMHFEQVMGVDISARMLELARRHNRQGERVSYVHNIRPDLAAFADGTFDFVYSLITLQHIPPPATRRYLAEFVRVLKPEGAALFQRPARITIPILPRRFSLWPPTVAKKLWRVVNRTAAVAPVMEMHAIPKEKVISIVRDAGGEIIDLWPHDAAGDGFESYAYLVRGR